MNTTTVNIPRPNKDRLTARELIVDTLAVYREGNRGVDRMGQCLYRHPDDPERRCALGRWFDEEKTPGHIWDVIDGAFSVARMLPDQDLDRILLPAVRGFSLVFWSDIQGLHDGSNRWDEDGPTDEGIKCATVVLRAHVDKDAPPITRAEVDAWREEHYGGLYPTEENAR